MSCVVQKASSTPHGIDIRNGLVPISNGKLHEADVMKPSATSGSPTRSRGSYMETSRGVYDAVRDAVAEEERRAMPEEANIKREVCVFALRCFKMVDLNVHIFF